MPTRTGQMSMAGIALRGSRMRLQKVYGVLGYLGSRNRGIALRGLLIEFIFFKFVFAS